MFRQFSIRKHDLFRTQGRESWGGAFAAAWGVNVRALRLYRRALKTALSWCVMRGIFYDERDRIRREFEKMRGVGLVRGKRAIDEGYETLEGYAHPDPYIVPTMYGGSKYARNPPVPGEIKIMKDFGREKETVPTV